MLKAFALGLSSVLLAVLLVTVISMFGTQPSQESGLLWGGKVYTTRQEFNGYLKSKGLSYKTWVARNPDAAPWEPEELTIGPLTVRLSAHARENWVVRLPLVALGLMFATGCGVLLAGGLRSRGSVAAPKPAARFGAVVTLRQAMRASRSRRPGVLVHVTPVLARIRSIWAAGIHALPSARRLGAVGSGGVRRLKVSAPTYGARLVDAARADARQLPKLMEHHSISVGYLAFGLLAAVVAGTLALYVVSLLSP